MDVSLSTIQFDVIEMKIPTPVGAQEYQGGILNSQPDRSTLIRGQGVVSSGGTVAEDKPLTPFIKWESDCDPSPRLGLCAPFGSGLAKLRKD